MQNIITTTKNYLETKGFLDTWTVFHIAAGAFFCKLALWLGSSNTEALYWVFGVAIAWEIFEYLIENWRPYGTKQRWFNNTISDIVVAMAIAIWMVI